jgi:hypothetical protein
VAEEIGPALAWANRNDWYVSYDSESLLLVCCLTHAADGGPLKLVAELSDYRALPPIWRFVDPSTNEPTPDAFPQGQPILGQSSIFHPQGLICAPWSRLAYAEHQGPHNDWGGPGNWLAAPGGPFPTTLAEMLAMIDTHLSVSPRRLA